MIRYQLRCAAGHGFDGWFRSSSDFDAQAESGLLACPACGSAEVGKALMAPALAGARTGGDRPDAKPEDVALVDDKQAKIRGMLRELRQHLTQDSENVGERFPEVARQMHAEEIERRSIHGRASANEAKALAEEGVEIHPLPGFPDDMN